MGVANALCQMQNLHHHHQCHNQKQDDHRLQKPVVGRSEGIEGRMRIRREKQGNGQEGRIRASHMIEVSITYT